MEDNAGKIIVGLLIFSLLGGFGGAGFYVFIVVLGFGIICLIFKCFSKDSKHPPSGNQLRKNVTERIELKNKYKSKIPPRTPDGKLYTNSMQIYDKVGIYSPEYYQEWKELTNRQRAREGKPPLYDFEEAKAKRTTIKKE